MVSETVSPPPRSQVQSPASWYGGPPTGGSVATAHSNRYSLPPARNFTSEDDQGSVGSFRSGAVTHADMRPCSACQRLNDVDANFCSRCGMKLTSAPVQSIPEVESPARALSPQSVGSARNMRRYLANKVADPSMSRLSFDSFGGGAGFSHPGTPTSFEMINDAASTMSQEKTRIVDPLKRTGCPLVSFGFGGKMIVMHTRKQNRYVNKNGVMSTTENIYHSVLQLHSVKNIKSSDGVPISAFLVSDAASIGARPMAKAKKKEVSKWIEGLAAMDGKSKIVQFLKVFMDSDGKLFQSPTWPLDLFRKVVSVPVLSKSTVVSPSITPAPRVDEYTSALSARLMEGDTLGAVKLAVEAEMWSHAMILSRHISADVYAGVVQSFVSAKFTHGHPLRTAFMLFSQSSQGIALDLFAGASGSTSSAVDKWPENLAVILANRTANDSMAISQLGDVLVANGYLDCGHLCYILAGLSLDGVDSPGSKYVLLNCSHIQYPLTYWKDVHSLRMTESYEYMQRLQNLQFILPHFQAYKLVHAITLNDYGLVEEARL